MDLLYQYIMAVEFVGNKGFFKGGTKKYHKGAEVTFLGIFRGKLGRWTFLMGFKAGVKWS